MPDKGLYIITDHRLSVPSILKKTEQSLASGANLVQMRTKHETHSIDKAHELARALKTLCSQYKTPLIINDDIKLAQRVEADGVHLGQHDANILEARQQLGNSVIIGVSCYNSIDLAVKACRQGADYVAFGRFFYSTSKPLATPADIQQLRHAKNNISVPIVAIGGITPENGGQLVAEGADMLAVIEGVYGQDDVALVTSRYLQLFNTPPHQSN
ncbi:MAG: thiamine phosphate synthase [Gammaproteobacteria bacterium]|nr:thiamine phosphate synthase [Gammaproteobacteria bacterium]